MNHAALSCKVVSSSIIVVREFFARTISSGGNSRLTLATADNFDGAMIDCDCQNLLFFSEQTAFKSCGCTPLSLEQYPDSASGVLPIASQSAHTTAVVYKCALVPREAVLLNLQNNFFKNYHADFRGSVFPVIRRADFRKLS